MNDQVLLSIAVTLIVIGISLVFYLLYQEEKPYVEEDFLKMNSDESPTGSNLPEEGSQEGLSRLLANQDKDITKIKGVTDEYEWTQNESEVCISFYQHSLYKPLYAS